MAAQGELPAASLRQLQPAPDARTIMVTIDGRIERADAKRLGDHFREIVADTGAEVVFCDVGGLVDPDGAAIDALCRIRLAARRLGCRLTLVGPSNELSELLDLTGINDVLPVDPGSGFGAEGQTKQREHPGRVEEKRDPADPPV